MRHLSAKRFVLLPLLAGALALSCGRGRSTATDGAGGEISISGAFALYPLAVRWAGEYQELHPEVRIDISAGGAGKGMTDVLAGVVDLGMVSREIYAAEQEAGALGFVVAKDAVVPTVNRSNPRFDEMMKRGLTREAAVKIWITGEARTWGDVLGTADRTPLRAYTRSDACGAAETWALWLGAKQEDLGGTAVFGDPGVAAAVQKDNLGIGMNNIGYVYDDDTHRPNPGLAVMPVDVNGDGTISPEENFYDTKEQLIEAIAGGRYPSPPARDLYLVARGVPENPAVLDFLRYVLTQGQNLNMPAGYIALSEESAAAALRMLNKTGEE